MTDFEMKVWKCPNGHGLGVVRKNGRGLHQLLLYRHAISDENLNPRSVDVMAVVEGSVMDIRCDICQEMRTWIIGQEAIDKLLARCLNKPISRRDTESTEKTLLGGG